MASDRRCITTLEAEDRSQEPKETRRKMLYFFFMIFAWYHLWQHLYLVFWIAGGGAFHAYGASMLGFILVNDAISGNHG